MKMTIEQLLKKLTTDEKFAKEFKVLTDRCCKDRDTLLKVGLVNEKASQDFLESWGTFHKKFAFDPTSLAALSLPKVRLRAGKCDTQTRNFTVLTGTQVQELYEKQRTPRRKTGTKAKPKPGAAKKKASKLK